MDMQPFMGSLGTGAGIGAGGGMAFFAFKWLVEWISGRMDKKQERLDRIQDDLIKGLLKDVSILKDEVNEARTENATMRVEIRNLHKQLNECEARHVEADGKIVKLEGMLQAQGVARQQAQQIIAAERRGEI